MSEQHDPNEPASDNLYHQAYRRGFNAGRMRGWEEAIDHLSDQIRNLMTRKRR